MASSSLISVAIQAHPRRAHLAEALNRCLAGAAEIVYDPDPGAAPSAWRTYREVLLRTPAHCTHRLILQEDVLICDGFLPTVERIAKLVPNQPVCLYVGGRPHQHARHAEAALGAGQRWLALSNQTWIPVVTTLWPQALCLPMVEWADRQFDKVWPSGFTADDEICGKYLNEMGLAALATVPSLVEHPDTEAPQTLRKTYGGLDPARRAAVWIGDLGICDARDLEWPAP